ncbi:hypothetical protein PDESU_01004 [Pontiella desulfatans]|uniref:Uncharacterized protein n=1 Tax=Pontiella desulfatans TaxID=2750659 RepID=A0A6C2TYM4_PONDE|nr:hypothetical protein [Pontiella desulfatans]VGO12451.1 hypothetical protein PDESU_01004 [Pontiella desulfatans]
METECSAEQVSFENLLAGLTARFINLPSEEVDSAIEDAQREVCEFLGLDLSAVWQMDPDASEILVLTHLYGPLLTEEVPERMVASELFPWALEKVQNNEVFVLSSTEN